MLFLSPTNCVIAAMTELESIKQKGIEVINNEIEALQQMSSFIDDQFAAAVALLRDIKGRIVISGIGKSAIIAQKIVATMNSTGTPALFMHAADAIHGDLGMIQPDDAVMVISKSGESPEIKALVPLIRNFGNAIIALCGTVDSYLAKNAHYFINTTIAHEACPNNLAPTTSTTAQMVMGDAIAIALLGLKGFTAADFAKFHPGGALGKRLYLTVGDLSRQNEQPFVDIRAGLKEVILEISGKRLGMTAVLKDGALYGIITDGDLRRMLERNVEVSHLTAADICTINPKHIDVSELAVNALEQIRNNNITQMIVTENGKYAGVIHMHDLLREGLI
jgi:arabinose-5-phosphate isomerase